MHLESESSLEVITDIPESLIREVSQGEQLPVYIPAVDLEITATVKEVAPSADPQSRTVPVKLTLPRNDTIRLGQFARVRLPGTKGSSVMLPADAIQRYGQIERIFTVEENTAQLRLVKTGLKHGMHIEVLSGLEAGEKVILSSESKLLDGQPVSFQ